MPPTRNIYGPARVVDYQSERRQVPGWLVFVVILTLGWSLTSSVMAQELSAGMPSNGFIDFIVVDQLTLIGDWIRLQAGQLATSLRNL